MTILYILLASVCFLILFYLLSRIQMKAWIQEIDLHFGKKFTNFINNKNKKENDNETEK
jgi:hypothetical protein